MKTLGRWFALVVMLIAVPLVRLAAQAASSVIKGRILMAEPRRPIAGARIVLVGTPHSATTDSRGTFAFEGLDAGPYTIQASAIGFTTLSSPLLLKERETLEVEFVAHAEAANLPDLVVEEENRNEPADWNRRRTEGQGRYITRAQLENRRVATLPDALRIIPGVRIECRTNGICVARMSRAPRGCSPGYFLDGVPADQAVLWLTPVSDIHGIEVYAGPSETPPELEGYRSRCGAIALWTRPPPPRRPKQKKPPVDTAAVPPDTTWGR